MLKLMRKTVTILLVISLIYANAAGTAFSIISYALDHEEGIENTEETEKQEEFALEIETSEFGKNNMADQETEYQEKLNLKLYSEKELNEIKIQDLETTISDGTVEENIDETESESEIEEESKTEVEPEEKIDVFYKSTKISKEELIKAIGENGSLEIQYIELSTENKEEVDSEEATLQVQSNIIELEEMDENTVVSPEEDSIAVIPEKQEDTAVLSEMPEENEIIEEEKIEEDIESEEVEEDKTGIINAEEGTVIINAETEADEEGYITIIYPEKSVVSVNINIATEINDIENLEILHTRVVEKVPNIETANLLETAKQIIVNGEEEIFNQQEIFSMPINYTKTVAEIGIDKNKISTSIENKVNFTITMLTNEIKYDLYKNPSFIIELPSEIEKINIDNTVILNNQSFEIDSVETGTIENGSKAIAIKLKGEQTEYTNSNEENIQIVIETTITTNNLIPTLERNINLHYKNENAKTYDGIGVQEAGIDTILVNLVSNKEIIVETKATVGEETVISFEEDFATINVAPHTYNMAKINGTVINNIGEEIVNAKILGTIKNIGPLSGVENVYYTENENATVDMNDINNGWTTEYTQNAKKYLILIENFEQAQTVNFEYYMYMPEVVEDDTSYVLTYEVYDSNNEILKTSYVTINQEAERFDYYEDENIQANVQIENEQAMQLWDIVKANVNIKNNSGEDLENISVYVNIPIKIEEMLIKIFVNGEQLEGGYYLEDNELFVNRAKLEKDSVITISISGGIGEYKKPTEKFKATISYEQKEIEISNKIKIIEPSQIQTTITSDKMGKVLEENEAIQYKVMAMNNGESHSKVDICLPELEYIQVNRCETTNLSTGEINCITGVDMSGVIHRVSLNPGEIIEIKLDAVTNEIEKDTINNMYVDIVGKSIYDTTTQYLSNEIKKQETDQENLPETELPEEKLEQEENIEIQNNSVEGIAWLDKNNDGRKDNSETLLKGIVAVLIETESLTEVDRQITNSRGEYEFNNISNGNYIVEFRYNTDTLSVTDYKSEGGMSDIDSDIINTTQNNQTIAKTEVLALEKGTNENINAGFVINKKFDMSINKGITKVTVSNEKGTDTYNFDNTSMAKVEIDGEYLKGSLILVEYEIAVTNSGEVAGYAKMISDKMPEGMKFNSELNNNWYQDDDGTLYCEELANKELLPGETAIVKLVLTKEMTDDKVISPVNTVRLEETFNEYLIEDKKTENNMSEATIIISLTTGETDSYIWLVLVVIAIITTGIFGVIRVTNKDVIKDTTKERRK